MIAVKLVLSRSNAPWLHPFNIDGKLRIYCVSVNGLSIFFSICSNLFIIYNYFRHEKLGGFC